ncbi:hypothetical protein O0L34_g14300 [Tuta absoluta]|nr:hypothetical protein O0L34_g14300 [Tuta absoluta]
MNSFKDTHLTNQSIVDNISMLAVAMRLIHDLEWSDLRKRMRPHFTPNDMNHYADLIMGLHNQWCIAKEIDQSALNDRTSPGDLQHFELSCTIGETKKKEIILAD